MEFGCRLTTAGPKSSGEQNSLETDLFVSAFDVPACYAVPMDETMMMVRVERLERLVETLLAEREHRVDAMSLLAEQTLADRVPPPVIVVADGGSAIAPMEGSVAKRVEPPTMCDNTFQRTARG